MGRSAAFLFVIAFLVARSMAARSEVKENNLPIDCCEPKIQINLTCEIILYCKDETVAYFSETAKECHPPCKVVEGNMMTLSECVNVTMKTWCTNGNGKSEEYVTKFFSQPCPASSHLGNSSPGYQASITLLLIHALMAAKFLLQGIC